MLVYVLIETQQAMNIELIFGTVIFFFYYYQVEVSRYFFDINRDNKRKSEVSVPKNDTKLESKTYLVKFLTPVPPAAEWSALWSDHLVPW
jgi:hypothetical protein